MSNQLDTKSLREWLASWGDGPHHADPTGQTVPIAKTSLVALLDAHDRLATRWQRAELFVRAVIDVYNETDVDDNAQILDRFDRHLVHSMLQPAMDTLMKLHETFSAEDIDTHLREAGVDPDALVARMRPKIDALLAKRMEAGRREWGWDSARSVGGELDGAPLRTVYDMKRLCLDKLQALVGEFGFEQGARMFEEALFGSATDPDGWPLRLSRAPEPVVYASDDGPAPTCRGCNNKVDLDVCHCGVEASKHNSMHDGHEFVPMGCDCAREEHEDDMAVGPSWSALVNSTRARQDVAALEERLVRARQRLRDTEGAVDDAVMKRINALVDAE